MNRALAILADTILVIITWKFLPSPAITRDIAPTKGRIRGKPEALASIMLYNGMSRTLSITMVSAEVLALPTGMTYFM